MKLFDSALQVVGGVETLRDWVGSGFEPVSKEKAEKRSLVCIHCPLNKEPGWLERNVTHPAAKFIRAQLEIKNKAELRVFTEDQISMCAACGCYLPLKVFSPIEHIKEHASVETLAKMPPYCWVRQEILETT